MRADQIAGLRDLQEKLADVVLYEADPDNWSGSGISMADMSKEARGNRYFDKKNAAATFALLQRNAALIAQVRMNSDAGDDEDLGAEIEAAEKEAARILERVSRGG